MKHWSTWAAVGLLGLMATLAVLSVKNDSATNDEIAHIAAGYSYLTAQDYRLNPEHPPLAKDLAAFPLLFMDLQFPWSDPSWTEAVNDQWGVGQLFLYELGNDADAILFWSRMPMVFLLVALGFFLWWWLRRLTDQKFALLGLALFVFSPTFLAHGRLVTTDIAAVLGFLLSFYCYFHFLAKPSWKTALITGGVLAFALLVKFSTVVLLPFFGLLLILYTWSHQEDGWKDRAKQSALWMGGIFLVSLGIIWIAYQLHLVHYPVDRQVNDAQIILDRASGGRFAEIPLEFANNDILRPYVHYAVGLFRTGLRVGASTLEYFLGETGHSGWWYYFPIVYLVKVPLAFHVLSLFVATIAIYLLIKRRWDGKLQTLWREHFFELSFLLFITLYVATAISSSMNYGVRHLLPIFPLLYILVTVSIWKWYREVSFPDIRIKGVLLVLLFGWYIWTGISAFPHFLSYYNELAGGVDDGYKIAGHSNYDWGQDLKRLAKWAEEQKIERLYLDFFGRAEPRYYLGERYVPWRGSSWWELHGIEVAFKEEFPRGNYLAVSATFLASGGWMSEGYSEDRDYAWLDDYTPVGRAGKSIFIYYIE